MKDSVCTEDSSALIFKISRNTFECEEDMKNLEVMETLKKETQIKENVPPEAVNNTIKISETIFQQNYDKLFFKKLNQAMLSMNFTLKLDGVNNQDFKKIVIDPNPKSLNSIPGISENEVCDSNLTFEKKLLENLFDSYALRLAVKQKQWLNSFICDKNCPKGNKRAKYEVIQKISETLQKMKKDKPSEIMEINFQEILEEIENKGHEVDFVCMDFVELTDFLKKTLTISEQREEEKLDQEFQDTIRNYTDNKEWLQKKKQRIFDAVASLQIACGDSDQLTEKYERMFLDEVFDRRLDRDIPAYFKCLDYYKKLLIDGETKSDLKFLVKLCREEITDEDLKQLLMVGSKSGGMGPGLKYEKDSLAKDRLLTPLKNFRSEKKLSGGTGNYKDSTANGTLVKDEENAWLGKRDLGVSLFGGTGGGEKGENGRKMVRVDEMIRPRLLSF